MSNTEDQEREYCTRVCWLIMTVGKDIVRQKLDGLYPPGIGVGTLDDMLNRRSTVSKLNNLKAFNRLDLSRLYPSTVVPVCSKDCDISLLIKLLRNICSLPKPKSGWDNLPVPADISLSDDLARIKYYRNKIAHLEEFRLSEDDFDTYWKELSGAFIRLGGPSININIERLLKEPLTEYANEAKQELEQWGLKDLDVNNKLEKIAVICERIEENRDSTDLTRKFRDFCELLAYENAKTTDALSIQQDEIHQTNKQSVDRIGERVRKMEKSSQTRETIILVVLSLFAVVPVVFYMCTPSQSALLSVLIIIGYIVWLRFGQSPSEERPVPVRSSLRSLTDKFIGRNEDISKITDILHTKKMVVVCAPFGFGKSEVFVAVGRQFNATSVVYADMQDMRDMSLKLSGELITLLGLNPLSNTVAQLKAVCPNLKNTLFILDNIDYIFGKNDFDSDFENTVRVLLDGNICRGVKILCATPQSFGVLRELGIEYKLSSLTNENSVKLLLKLCPKLGTERAESLASVSKGIPLVIHLIKDMYKYKHTSRIFTYMYGIDDTRENIPVIGGLKEKRRYHLTIHQTTAIKSAGCSKTRLYDFSGTLD